MIDRIISVASLIGTMISIWLAIPRRGYGRHRKDD